MAATLMFCRAPPLKMFMKPRTVLSRKMRSSWLVSIPGTGRLEVKRNRTRMANVKNSFWRMSGCDRALIAACSSCGRCCCALLAVATADLHYFAAGGFDPLLSGHREAVGLYRKGLGERSAGQHLHRPPQAAQHAPLSEQLRGHLPAAVEAFHVAHVHRP